MFLHFNLLSRRCDNYDHYNRQYSDSISRYDLALEVLSLANQVTIGANAVRRLKLLLTAFGAVILLPMLGLFVVGDNVGGVLGEALVDEAAQIPDLLLHLFDQTRLGVLQLQVERFRLGGKRMKMRIAE